MYLCSVLLKDPKHVLAEAPGRELGSLEAAAKEAEKTQSMLEQVSKMIDNIRTTMILIKPTLSNRVRRDINRSLDDANTRRLDALRNLGVVKLMLRNERFIQS